MGLLESIDRLIVERGSAVVLRERLVQLREQCDRLQKEHSQLEAAHQELLEERNQLAEQLKKLRVTNEFVEYRGSLFRRQANGDLEVDAYCPDCLIPMTSLMKITPMRCSKCKREAAFNGHELRSVVAAALVAHPKNS